MLVKIMDEMDLACLKSVVDKFDDLIGDISVIKGTLIAENKETDIDRDLAEAKGIAPVWTLSKTWVFIRQ